MRKFEKLRKEWERKLYAFAFSYVRSQEVAEDLVQDVFLKVLEDRVDVFRYDNPGPLLITIMKNKCLDYLKHKLVVEKHSQSVEEINYRKTEKYSLEDDSIRLMTDSQMQKVLASAIRSLPAKSREILILSKFRGLSYNELAQRFGTTPKSIEYQISKAMSILREKMKGYYILMPLAAIINFF